MSVAALNVNTTTPTIFLNDKPILEVTVSEFADTPPVHLPVTPPDTPAFVLGSPKNGIIAKRRDITRAIKSITQRHLRKQRSFSGSLKSQRSFRTFSLEKPKEISAIECKRAQHRAKRAQRMAGRSAQGHLKASTALLAKKASFEGSEMHFFGEFKANPGPWDHYGCVVS